MLPGVTLPQPSYKKNLLSVLFAISIFTLGIAVDRLVAVSGWLAGLDDAAAAIAVGLLIYLFERHRERMLLERLQTIALMNHHVRNALQPVMYLPYSQDQELQMNTVRDAVKRIDWALREILPGSSPVEPPSRITAA